MFTNKSIKKEAAEILKQGNWFPAVGSFMFALITTICANFIVSFIVSLLTPLSLLFSEYVSETLMYIPGFETLPPTEDLAIAFLGFAALALFVFSFILVMPFVLGCVRYLRCIAYSENPAFFEVFYYISHRYKKAMSFSVKTVLSCLWRIIISFIPLGLVSAVLNFTGLFDNSLDFSTVLCYLILCIVFYLCTLFSAKFCNKFVFSIFAFLENENLTTKEAVYFYNYIPLETQKTPFRLFFSLSLWIFPCLIIIPLVFVVPYALVCFFVLQKKISPENN